MLKTEPYFVWFPKPNVRISDIHCRCLSNITRVIVLNFGYFFFFSKVAYYMQNRTKEQCYQRWTLSAKNGIRRGHFLEIEDFLIIIAVKLFGKNWAKISEIIPQRGPSQIHSRYILSIFSL